MRAPDVAFVRRARIPTSGPPAGYWPGPPDLAVEVLSPGDTRSEVDEKTRAWLAAGTRLVWVVDPERHRVAVHEPGRSPRQLAEGEFVDGGGLLSKLRLPVADALIF